MMISHLKHMAKVRPPGSDRQAAEWALAEIERLNDKVGNRDILLAMAEDLVANQKAEIDRLRGFQDAAADLEDRLETAQAEIERLRAERSQAPGLPWLLERELRAENERLRGVIGDLLWDIGHDNDLNEAAAKAKTALAGKP